jgi:hypothetical protein
MDDPVTVALKRRANRRIGLGLRPEGRIGAGGGRGQERLFPGRNALGEGLDCGLGHEAIVAGLTARAVPGAP